MDPFVAEIRIFGFTFAPTGWAFCDGQILPISQNAALFSLLGTNFGGDGRSNFALPNLQGSLPMHPGQGPGLSNHVLGEAGGTTSVQLSPSQMPSHTHALVAAVNPALDATPSNNVVLAHSRTVEAYVASTANIAPLAAAASAAIGGNQPHNNLQPYLVLNFCIALQGIYPPRG